MNPITPQRFIELMEKTDKRYIKLWHSELEKHLEIKYIWKTDPYIWEGKAYKGGSYLLTKLYESKPETPLEQLDKLIQKNERRNFSFHESLSGSIVQWRNKYESQLKELK